MMKLLMRVIFIGSLGLISTTPLWAQLRCADEAASHEIVSLWAQSIAESIENQHNAQCEMSPDCYEEEKVTVTFGIKCENHRFCVVLLSAKSHKLKGSFKIKWPQNQVAEVGLFFVGNQTYIISYVRMHLEEKLLPWLPGRYVVSREKGFEIYEQISSQIGEEAINEGIEESNEDECDDDDDDDYEGIMVLF